MRARSKDICLIIGLLWISVCVPMQGFGFGPITCGPECEINVYGFLRNNAGMFTRTHDQAGSGNQLATARTWLRTYGDVKFNEQFRYWIATQFVYEPWYKVERGNSTAENGGPQQHRRSGWKQYSEFDDVNDVLRENYVEWRPNKSHSIKMGRQIAIWGEALTSRVGDIVHPDDSRFAFGFSNLEDTRIPQYMLRGVHEVAPLRTSFEWITIAPVVEGQYYVNRGSGPNATADQRFSPYAEDRNATREGLPHGPNVLPSFAVTGSRDGAKELYPDGWAGWRYGARTTTLIGGFQFGFSYFHTHQYQPLLSYGAVVGKLGSYKLRDLYLSHPYVDYFGATMNKQLPWPGVVRSEMVYSPNMPLQTFRFSDTEDSVVRRDYAKFLIAYDLNGLLYFSWHKDASFDITLEYIGEWIPNAGDIQYGTWYTKYPGYHSNVNAKISTTWDSAKWGTALIVGYDTFGKSGLLMPTVSYTPAWNNEKLSFQLQYIGVYGDNNYEGLGIYRQKSLVVLTSQLNF